MKEVRVKIQIRLFTSVIGSLFLIIFSVNAHSASTQARIAKLPLSFEVNAGQAQKDVRFLARGRKFKLFLTPDEATLAFGRSAMHMKLAGANRSPRVEGQEELPGKTNYLIGNDPRKWRTNISSYATVRYANVYRGVDLVYYGNQ